MKLSLSVFILFFAVQIKANSVEVINPIVENISDSITLTGDIEAVQNSALAVYQSGLVANIYVEQGDVVNKGQKLLGLDNQLAQLALLELQAESKSTKTTLQEAKRQLAELLSLSKAQLVAETLIQERKAKVKLAQAAQDKVQAQIQKQQEIINRHTLYAPFTGVVMQRHTDVGEWVSNQNPVFTLVANSNLRLKLAVPQEYVPRLAGHSNIKVLVKPDSLDGYSINAELSKLVKASNNSSRTYTALISLSYIEGLAPGMSAQAEIIIPSEGETLIWLPKTAIKQHPDGGASVFYVTNGLVKRQFVRIHKTKNNLIGVFGASTDKVYVVSGVELLKEGDSVSASLVKG